MCFTRPLPLPSAELLMKISTAAALRRDSRSAPLAVFSSPGSETAITALRATSELAARLPSAESIYAMLLSVPLRNLA